MRYKQALKVVEELRQWLREQQGLPKVALELAAWKEVVRVKVTFHYPIAPFALSRLGWVEGFWWKPEETGFVKGCTLVIACVASCGFCDCKKRECIRPFDLCPWGFGTKRGAW